MFQFHTLIRRFILVSILVLSVPALLHAQGIRPRPRWWFGGAGAANLNWYNGTAQILSDSLTTPVPFHQGSGVGPYLALGLEYRPNPVWGGMLYVGYDDRRGKWDDVVNPCDTCTASLSTTLSYISIEPSLRIAPFSSRFYVFLGPRVGINMAKTFTYKKTDSAGQQRQSAKDEWSAVRSTVVSGQVGMGYDISLSSPHDRTQVDLSPFVSFHPYFGQNPRSEENWAVTTVRAGVILKLGRSHKEPTPAAPTTPVVTPPPVVTPSPPDTTGQAERERQARMDADRARVQIVYFDLDKSDIRGEQRAKVKTDAEIFRTWTEWQVTVEGYCDKRGTNEYNLALGERRATSAKQALVAEGIAATRITTISYGEERPADPGHDESAWSHNRRTEFKVK